MRVVIVELDDETREFFERPADGFEFARDKENERENSVAYVVVADIFADRIVQYRGDALKQMIDALDLRGWI